jgi:hypothetical protein
MFTFLFKGATSKRNALNTLTILDKTIHNILLNIQLSIENINYLWAPYNEGRPTNLGLITKKDPLLQLVAIN